MSESKRHHFVPQSILRRFAAAGSDRVWIYDKQTGASFASSVLQTGMERGFNIVVIEGKRINFEGDFNDVDGRMADLHTRLVDSRRLGCLSTDDRNHLADAAAVQLLRTKMLRSTVRSVTDQLMGDMARVGLLSGELPSFDENAARQIARNAFHDRDGHRRSLAKLDLLLVRPEDGQKFWTSDNPIVRYNPQPYGETGLTSPGVEIYWPIAPDLTIAFLCPTLRQRLAAAVEMGDDLEEPLRSQAAELHRGFVDGVPVLLGRGGTAAFLNQLQVRSSSRFLYAQDRDFSFAATILEANPKLKAVDSMIKVGRIGEGPEPRATMPAGLHMVVYGREDHAMVALDWRREAGWGFEAKPTEPIYLDMLMANLPWREVRIFEDGHEMRGTREVKVAVVHGADGGYFVVQPLVSLPLDAKP